MRAFLAEAGDEEDLDPDVHSFVHSVWVVRRRLQNPGLRRRTQAVHIQDRCREILEEQVVSSRGLHRPRGVKCKMGNYPFLESTRSCAHCTSLSHAVHVSDIE